MIELIILLFVIAFISEYAAATLGMGYGTTLAPVLIIMGYEPLILVPVVLVSQFIAGFVSAGFHHRFENMKLSENEDERTALSIFSFLGVFGVMAAAFTNIGLPPFIVKIYIASVVMLMGGLMLLNGGREWHYSRTRLGVIGIIAAFNKGISGGGYGPLATPGQIMSGIRPRAAIAITALVEGIVCAAGIVFYFLLTGPPDLLLSVAITLGATLAAPLSALTTAHLEQNLIKRAVAVSTFAIGVVTFIWIILAG